jgi:transcriptional regulator with XRE-family HTH domain
MLASEARAARIALGLSEDALAAETNTTPAIVDAWETGRIKVPRQAAVDLTWRMAQVERLAALETSGLPECSWIAAFDAEPEAQKLRAQQARADRFLAHNKECEICKARAAYITDRFPPMPPAPREGWVAVVMPIAERVQRLPAWARPIATGVILFVAYSLLRLIFLLPSIIRSPREEIPTAITGIALSASIGAALGFLYGQYRRWRDRRTAPGDQA